VQEDRRAGWTGRCSHRGGYTEGQKPGRSAAGRGRRLSDQPPVARFAHGLLGEGASGPDFVGMEFPGGNVIGNAKNVKLRFDAEYMEMAAAGKL
jgi:hypothetical protein